MSEESTDFSWVYFPATKNYPYPRKWALDFIWELSKDLEVEKIEVDALWEERYGEAWCWQHEDEVINNDFFLHHMSRVMTADLSFPIVLSEEDYIFDGVHRLMKAKYLGLKTIHCVRFKRDPECF